MAAATIAFPSLERVTEIKGVLLPAKEGHVDINLSQSSNKITGIHNSTEEDNVAGSERQTKGLLVLPSLCHPHIHLDKPHLLTHPSTSTLRPTTGSFTEALSLTAKAKQCYRQETIQERMQALLADSSRAGVTHIRGFAEVDATVNMAALDAALDVKRQWADRVHVQVCAFAQDPMFSGENAPASRSLMEEAVTRDGVEALGSTPYVEADTERARRNVEWAVRTAMKAKLHLDLHLDYNVDPDTEPLIWWVIEVLQREKWTLQMPEKTICLGHCTRLTLFKEDEWARLQGAVKDLPIYFVGLPTSDLFMMGRPLDSKDGEDKARAALRRLQDRKRCTLQIPAMIDAGFNATLGINNVGNAFTPYGPADPLTLAQWGVGIYQVGTLEATEVLFDCVSRRAKQAIGVVSRNEGTQDHSSGQINVGDSGDLLLIGRPYGKEHLGYRRRTAVSEAVWDAGADRQTIFKGNWVRTE